MYLQELHGHENIVQIINVLKAENDNDIYIVTDFMESDLHAVIKAGILEEVHKQYIIYQVLRALKYMHSGQLIHRDIKPSNVLLNSDCALKMCDFGLARSVAPIVTRRDVNPIMTDYVATRWYRAPEILLGSPNYTKGVDVWAVGCILAEMMLKRPVFPGTSTLDQLERVIEVTGKPSASDIESIKSPFAATMLESIRQPERPRSLSDIFPRAPEDLLDFLRKCFQFNPNKRPWVDQLLTHPFLSQFHDPSSEPECQKTIRIPLDDNIKLTVNDYRNRICESVIKKKKENKRANASPDLPGSPSRGSAPLQKQYSASAYCYPTPAHPYTRASSSASQKTSATFAAMSSGYYKSRTPSMIPATTVYKPASASYTAGYSNQFTDSSSAARAAPTSPNGTDPQGSVGGLFGYLFRNSS